MDNWTQNDWENAREIFDVKLTMEQLFDQFSIAGDRKASSDLYRITNAKNENTSKKMINIMFGVFLPLAAGPGTILSYYKYVMNGNDVTSFKLMFYSA